jgi:glycerate 2-kinase
MKKKKMNILVAPNSMKGSLNAFEFADAIEKAFNEVSPLFSVRKLPVADGGDFTGEVLRRAYDAKVVELTVKDPLGRPVRSKYGVAGNTAIIEMADASGMKLLDPKELNPFETSSFGTGQLMADAIGKGCTEILLGVGGSATVDGGTGLLTSLGFQLLSENSQSLPGNGKNLKLIREIVKPALPENLSVKVISDVDNPLLGLNGAAAVFAPQKGADAEMVKRLEHGLSIWCDLLEKQTGKELSGIKGGGAAGGVAIPLLAYFNARIVPGADFILSRLNFEKHVRWADLVITGEGKIDRQTLHDKAPKAVADHARKAGKPVIAIAGATEKEASEAFDGMFSFTNGPVSLDDSMQNSKKLVFDFSVELARLLCRWVK